MKKTEPAAIRFEKYVEPEPMSGCFLWVGGTNPVGYGRFWGGQGRMVYAHRFAYEQAHGPIPVGKDVLHSCDNPPCVSLHHLRAGSASENQKDAVQRGRHSQRRKTHCPKGHAYDAVNNRGERYCRLCENAQQRARKVCDAD